MRTFTALSLRASKRTLCLRPMFHPITKLAGRKSGDRIAIKIEISERCPTLRGPDIEVNCAVGPDRSGVQVQSDDSARRVKAGRRDPGKRCLADQHCALLGCD